jgi:hypothetical protein
MRRLERFGVAHRDTENPAGHRLEDHRDPVAIPADRRCDRGRGAAVPRNRFDAAHDIDMREDPPAILAALHRGDLPAIEADQQHRGRRSVTTLAKLDLCLAAIESQRDQHFLAVTSSEVERMLDIGTIRADRLPTTVDDNLGRVDGGKIEKCCITVLALGRLAAGKRILPAEPIPVVDMERQCQHIGTAREFGQQRVGRRTGRATLGGKKLDQNRPFTRPGGRDANRQAERKEKCEDLDHAMRLHQGPDRRDQQSVSAASVLAKLARAKPRLARRPGAPAALTITFAATAHRLGEPGIRRRRRGTKSLEECVGESDPLLSERRLEPLVGGYRRRHLELVDDSVPRGIPAVAEQSIRNPTARSGGAALLPEGDALDGALRVSASSSIG